VTVKLRSVRPALILSALLLAPALAGCSGDEPDQKHVAEAGSQVGPPAPSAAVKQHTTAGGVAFTKHYFSVANYAFGTGRTEELVKLTAPTCEICRAIVGDVSYAYQRGKIRGGQITIKEVGFPHARGVIANQLVTYSVTPYEELGKTGKVLHHQPAKSAAKIIVKLEWLDGAWRVGQLGRVADKS